MWNTIGGVTAVIAFAALLYWVRFIAGWPSMKEKKAGTYADHFVYVNDDGSVRELTPEERDYLNTEFHPNDGNRPYIKDRYRDRSPDGKLSGFLLRKRLPLRGMKHNLYAWLGGSFALGLVSFCVNGFAADWPPSLTHLIPFGYGFEFQAVGIAANWLWIATMIAAPYFLRWRALWLLVTVPLVLFWPYVDYRLMEACAANARACL